MGWEASYPVRLGRVVHPPPLPLSAARRGRRRGEFGYGYFWWYNCHPSAPGLIEARTAVGNGQQRVFVLPGLDMFVTIFAGRYNDFTTGATLGRRILLEHVLPAVKTGVRPGCPGA